MKVLKTLTAVLAGLTLAYGVSTSQAAPPEGKGKKVARSELFAEHPNLYLAETLGGAPAERKNRGQRTIN